MGLTAKLLEKENIKIKTFKNKLIHIIKKKRNWEWDFHSPP